MGSHVASISYEEYKDDCLTAPQHCEAQEAVSHCPALVGWRSSLTTAGEVAGQSLVGHVHLCWSGWVRYGILSSHVSTDHPEPATRTMRLEVKPCGM